MRATRVQHEFVELIPDDLAEATLFISIPTRQPCTSACAGDGILAAVGLKINNARVEALNNKARLITRRAYGFRSARAALALIHLSCGPITLAPPHQKTA